MKKEKTNHHRHIINAKGRSLGRLAAEIASLLQGKNKADFVRYRDIGDSVLVENVEKMKITGKKIEQKVYYRHSGYFGGLKETPLKKLFKEQPAEVLKIAVFGMLPKNKLRDKMIKRLEFKK